MAKECPVCHRSLVEPEIKGRSTNIDFKCTSCGAELRLSLGLVFILALLFAAPCIYVSYKYFPRFTFLIGDALIFLAFALVFWPLRRVSVRGINGQHT